MLGIWSLTPGQVVEANKSPLPPAEGYWLIDADGREVELESRDGAEVYDGDRIELEAVDGGYELEVGSDEVFCEDEEALAGELLDLVSYVPSMDDIVDSMEEFEAAKEAGQGAIAMTRAATVEIDGVSVDLSSDRMWDEATYQALMTPVKLFKDVYSNRPDQHDDLADLYSEDVVERAMDVGNWRPGLFVLLRRTGRQAAAREGGLRDVDRPWPVVVGQQVEHLRLRRGASVNDAPRRPEGRVDELPAVVPDVEIGLPFASHQTDGPAGRSHRLDVVPQREVLRGPRSLQ